MTASLSSLWSELTRSTPPSVDSVSPHPRTTFAPDATIIFVLRSASRPEQIALSRHLAKHDMRDVAFVSDLGSRGDRAGRFEKALKKRKPTLLFLRRSALSMKGLREERSEGYALLERALLFADANPDREIVLCPAVVLWTRGADRPRSPFDPLLDALGQTALFARLAFDREGPIVRLAEPLPLVPLREERTEGREQRVAYALLRRIERERRAILGPRRKSFERQREQVLRSPRLRRVALEIAASNSEPVDDVFARATKILLDLAADPRPELMRTIEPVADLLARKVFSGIDVDQRGIAELEQAVRQGTLVLLPSHRSHVDYLILSYILYKHLIELPLVAAGDNLAFFPVGGLLRRGGAFFIRRDARVDKLYAAVLDAYVRTVLRDGFALEFYLEGGRSRTGKLLPPQLGLLNMIVDAALSNADRPVFFAPISIVYERTMEDVELAREKAGGTKERESARSLLAAFEALTEPYGRVSIQVGRIFSLDGLREELGLETPITPAKRRSLVSTLASRIMSEVNRVTAVTAGALVATALLDTTHRGLYHHELLERTDMLLSTALRSGARAAKGVVSTSGAVREEAILEALRTFERGGMVRRYSPDEIRQSGGERRPTTRDAAVYAIADEARTQLDLAKNSILHFFVPQSILSLAFLSVRADHVDKPALSKRATELLEILGREVMQGLTDQSREDFVTISTLSLTSTGALVEHGESFGIGQGQASLGGAAILYMHALHLETHIDGYRIAARALRHLSFGPLLEKDVALRAIKLGQQMFVGTEIERREAISRPLFVSAFESFIALGLVRRRNGMLELGERGEAGVRDIEWKLLSFSPRRTRSMP